MAKTLPDIRIAVSVGDQLWMEYDLRSCKANLDYQSDDGERCSFEKALSFMLESVNEDTWYLFTTRKEAS